MTVHPDTAVVFDINVYLDYILGDDGVWPLLPELPPPASKNSSADAIALAFASRFRLYVSEHILRNVCGKMLAVNHSEVFVDDFVELIVDMCQFSGGGVVEPIVQDAGIGDYEDGHILSLVRDTRVDARVLVSSDRDLLRLGPVWNGRLILPPRDFVRYAM